ncbi:MAG: universal stress protein [Gemmatimonadota bacterium]
MSNQIMVPLDGSRFSERALPIAVDIAARWHADLHLVRVDEDMRGPDTAWSRVVNESYLTELTVRIRIDSGLSVRAATLGGEIPHALDAYTRENDIDLVVMTTHGRGVIGRMWVGSVTDELVRRASVPVLMLRPQGNAAMRTAPWSIKHIVVALDGSPQSEVILNPAIKLARLMNARLSLVRVFESDVPTTYAAIVESQIDHGVDHVLDADARDYVERIAHRIADPSLRIDTIVLGDSTAADGIVHAAARCKADMIAMSTHGRTGWQRIAFGSVEADVVRATHVPMLVQRIASVPAFTV